ncbi:hypothetical protein [Streptomyces sp. NRRL F-5630]|uniref:hypothetical protein n=1 Tax=Streptomyces sp. NRRL F-5630 TaxID=1463864 RepID=UPI003D70B2D4
MNAQSPSGQEIHDNEPALPSTDRVTFAEEYPMTSPHEAAGPSGADEDQGELIFQAWLPSPELEAECAATEVPGHAKGIPAGEGIVRIPFRMVGMVREACDAAERAHVR